MANIVLNINFRNRDMCDHPMGDGTICRETPAPNLALLIQIDPKTGDNVGDQIMVCACDQHVDDLLRAAKRELVKFLSVDSDEALLN